MVIQFNVTKNSVKELVISYVTNKLMKLYRADNRIRRAEVNLKVEPTTGDKHCDISLYKPGDSFFASQSAGSFEEATLNTMTAIEMRLSDDIKEGKVTSFMKSHSWQLKKSA